MKLDFLPKSFGRTVKYLVFTYALVTVIYTGTRFYNITSSSHTRTRRSSIVGYQKDSFFVAPLSQQTIEQDEQDEFKRAIYFEQALSKSKNSLTLSELY
jgi:hypothetical protein